MGTNTTVKCWVCEMVMVPKEKSQRTNYTERYRLQFHRGRRKGIPQEDGAERRMEGREAPAKASILGKKNRVIREVDQIKTFELMN